MTEYGMRFESSIELLSGKCRRLVMEPMLPERDGYHRTRSLFEEGGYCFEVTDEWTAIENGYLYQREIMGRMEKKSSGIRAEGIRFITRIQPRVSANHKWRFCIPSILYTKPEELKTANIRSYMEDRLTGNLLCAYDCDDGRILSISKTVPSGFSEAPVRRKGENRFLHKTRNCSLGYEVTENETFQICLSFPYCEEAKSAALNAGETPVYGFYPLDGEEIHLKLSYQMESKQCRRFTDGVYETFRELARTLEEPIAGRFFSKKDAVRARMESLGKSYREFEADGAGFFFHFDPLKGYGSKPSGFSTSFQTIPHNSYVHILEYGFTGRQINAALIMARGKGGRWKERGEKAVDFFLQHCTKPNGWLYSLYDLNTKAPFYSCGDREGPRLHYISRKDEKGNYLRTMVEPMSDVLDCYRWYLEQGKDKREWLDAVVRFADFLVKIQNEDGSWYRAYQPNGTMADIGGDEGLTEEEKEYGRKAVTTIPIGFLCRLCMQMNQNGKESGTYRQAAARAAEYVLEYGVRQEHYQGGTLDNPNIVDKEAAQYTMAGLYAIYEYTGEERYLTGAFQAAKLFVTWNYIWNAPMQPGTFLGDKNFKTKGFGAINSIWGGGVVDIYSLFHLKELYEIGRIKQEAFLCEMAEWIAEATKQIVSHPEDDMGFAGYGMQPEGFGICPQGEDDGQIARGDIWGTLGWIYSAGIYGLWNYLDAAGETREVSKQ